MVPKGIVFLIAINDDQVVAMLTWSLQRYYMVILDKIENPGGMPSFILVNHAGTHLYIVRRRLYE